MFVCVCLCVCMSVETWCVFQLIIGLAWAIRPDADKARLCSVPLVQFSVFTVCMCE